MTFWIEAIGFIAAALTTSAGLPQLAKIIKSKQAGDVSLGLAIIFTIGVVFWFAYGILIDAWPIIAANFFSIIIWVLILHYKIKYT